MHQLRKVLALTRRLTNEYALSYPLAVWLASYLPKKALDRAALIESEKANCPKDKGVSEKLWAAVVAKYPLPDDPRRVRLIDGTLSYWNFLNSIPLATAAYKLERDTSLAPEVLIFGDDAVSNLRDRVDDLLHRAGISDRDKRLILDFYKGKSQIPESYIEKLMEQVRRTALQQE